MPDYLEFAEAYDTGKFATLVSSGLLMDIDNFIPPRGHSTVPEISFWHGKRVLITGLDGMVGSTLADMLLGMEAEVHGTVIRHASDAHPNIAHNLGNLQFHVHEANLCDFGRTADIIKECDPHVIFHQAAISFVPTSLRRPSSVVENNCVSATNVLEAAVAAKHLEGIQMACSSEQYGYIANESEIPVREENELRPTSTYAVTKVFTEHLAKAYYRMHRLPVVVTRCFNQEGPRRGSQFFTARIARQIRDILDGNASELVMGNPNAVRDFTHIHDTAAAQLLAVERGEIGETYNISSGIGITTGDYARLALRLYSLYDIPIKVDKSLMRNYERGNYLFDGFIGDSGKFRRHTGWAPEKAINDIITDGVDSYAKK